MGLLLPSTFLAVGLWGIFLRIEVNTILEYVTSITCALFKREILLKLANLMFESFKQTGRLVTNSQKFETIRMFFLGEVGDRGV